MSGPRMMRLHLFAAAPKREATPHSQPVRHEGRLRSAIVKLRLRENFTIGVSYSFTCCIRTSYSSFLPSTSTTS